MGIRGPHIGKGVVTKRHVEDALKFKTLDHILLCRGAGATITGNAGTAYGMVPASELFIDPSRYTGVRKVEAFFQWDPKTTAGGLRIYNAADAVDFAVSEPGVAGWRTDRINVTDTWKALTAEKWFKVESKGDGTTAPEIAQVFIIVECGNV